MANSLNKVTTKSILDATVATADIADDAVTAAKIGVLDGHLQFGDGIKAKFGAGDDIEIYHESNTSNIKNTTGNLVISDTDGDIHIQAKNGEHSIVAHADGSVKLYHNNIAKSETTTAGINLDNSGGTSGKGKLTFGNSGHQYIEGLDTGNGGSGSYLSFGDGTSERLRITSGGFIKYSGSSTADETNKVGRFLMPSHDTNEEDVQYFQMENEGSMNQLTIGGGSSSYNSATKLVFRTAAVDTVTGTSRFEIDSSGVAHFNGDVKVLSGDIQMGNGRGINFSATSDAGGMTSETFDDYEEGTWTPTLTNGPSISQESGRYIKVGKVVHAWWRFVTSDDGPSAHCRMHLPFTMTGTNPPNGGTAWDYNTSDIDAHLSSGSNAIFFYQATSALNGNNAQIESEDFRGCTIFEVA